MADGFSFRQFEVRHDRCAMKVGTDGVLLGAWAHGGRRVLDVGCGTGLVALMMAQRFGTAHVDGVELDGAAARQAADNVARSPFAQRVAICHSAFQTFAPSAPYDAIVSNPPFFVDGMQSGPVQRTLARHADRCFFSDFFAFCRGALASEGEVSLVIPFETETLVSGEAYLSGMLLARRVLLRTKRQKPVERCLLAFRKRRTGGAELAEQCLLTDDGSRSQWYDALTQSFYL